MNKRHPISGTPASAAPNAATPNAAVSEPRPLGSASNSMDRPRQ